MSELSCLVLQGAWDCNHPQERGSIYLRNGSTRNTNIISIIATHLILIFVFFEIDPFVRMVSQNTQIR
jgi:hypothetical protein